MLKVQIENHVRNQYGSEQCPKSALCAIGRVAAEVIARNEMQKRGILNRDAAHSVCAIHDTLRTH